MPLSAKNVLGKEKMRILAQWNSLIRRTLNKFSCGLGGREGKAGEKQKVHPVKEGSSSGRGFMRDFDCIISKQMVGVLVSVWVRHELQCYVRHPAVSCVGCGIMGCLGNKVASPCLSLSFLFRWIIRLKFACRVLFLPGSASMRRASALCVVIWLQEERKETR